MKNRAVAALISSIALFACDAHICIRDMHCPEGMTPFYAYRGQPHCICVIAAKGARGARQ